MQETEAPSFDEDECPVSRTLGAEPRNQQQEKRTNTAREAKRRTIRGREGERERERERKSMESEVHS